MDGYIYILSNSAYKDNLLKIGITDTLPSNRRVNELYTTGVPSPFEVEYYALVKNYQRVEKIVHSRLSGLRLKKNREFFKCSVPEAITTIRTSADVITEEVLYKSPAVIRAFERALQREKKAAALAAEEMQKNREAERLKKERETELAEHMRAENLKAVKLLVLLAAGLALIIWAFVAMPGLGLWFAIVGAFALALMLAIWGIWAFFQWLFSG